MKSSINNQIHIFVSYILCIHNSLQLSSFLYAHARLFIKFPY
jgi:hypothetical protein